MASRMIKIAFAFIFSLLVTLYIVPIFRALALRFNLVDSPNGKLKRHKDPTPYLGGVAVYCGFLASLVFTLPFANYMFLFFIGITLLLFVGLIDDLMPLKPYQKWFGQCLAAFCFVKSGFYLKEHVFYNSWNLPISFLWILTIINAFNLVDVMDGLATTLALMASVAFLVVALTLQHTSVAILLAALIGSLVAFLWYNKPNATIYLGDAGALWIGGFLAAIPFLFNWGTYHVHGYFAPFIILGIPILEVVTLVALRTYKGIPFYQGSPDHFSLYLQANGWNKNSILLYVALLSVALGSVAFLFVQHALSVAQVASLGVVFLIGWFLILRQK